MLYTANAGHVTSGEAALMQETRPPLTNRPAFLNAGVVLFKISWEKVDVKSAKHLKREIETQVYSTFSFFSDEILYQVKLTGSKLDQRIRILVVDQNIVFGHLTLTCSPESSIFMFY